MPLCASTKLVSSSLIGVWLLTASPSFCAAHCSQRCFSIFLPPLISVRCTVAVLLQLSHFMCCRPHARRACLSHSACHPPNAGVPIVFRACLIFNRPIGACGFYMRASAPHPTPDKSQSFPASPRL